MATSRQTPSGRHPHDFLHLNVAEALRERLQAGGIPVGGKLPALRQIALEFDVSTMTARQAIRKLEHDGHVYRIPGVGAFARPPGQVRINTRKVLALAATDLGSTFEMEIARGVEHAGQERGWAVQVLDAQHDPQVESRNMLALPESSLTGAIVIPTWGDSRCVDTLSRLLSEALPVVVADRIPPGLAADFVESDHEQGGYLATKHLLEHGHSRVFMLTPPPLVSSIAARIQGYQRALVRAGITPQPDWMVWLDLELQAEAFRARCKWRAAYQAVAPVLRSQHPPIAIFAVDPYTAWGVYEACRELSLRIPEDVSIVGFDDPEITTALQPPITIIRQRTEEIGRVAVELLDDITAAPPAPNPAKRSYRHVVIDVDLVERQSVARVPPVVG